MINAPTKDVNFMALLLDISDRRVQQLANDSDDLLGEEINDLLARVQQKIAQDFDLGGLAINIIENDTLVTLDRDGSKPTGGFSQILTQKAVSLLRSGRGNQWWGLEPNIPRLADGKLNPDWVEWLMGFPIGWTEGLTRKQRLVALGNALVPIIPEMIGCCIENYEND